MIRPQYALPRGSLGSYRGGHEAVSDESRGALGISANGQISSPCTELRTSMVTLTLDQPGRIHWNTLIVAGDDPWMITFSLATAIPRQNP